MEELVWNYSNGKLFSLFRDNHFIKYDEEPPFSGQDTFQLFYTGLRMNILDLNL